eukprot:EG_transcript_18383
MLEVATEKLAAEASGQPSDQPSGEPSSQALVAPIRATESEELLEMEAWRRAVLKGNAWGDCYYPYSDKYLLTEGTHHMAMQRQAVIAGIREAALYSVATDRRIALRQVYDDVHGHPGCYGCRLR